MKTKIISLFLLTAALFSAASVSAQEAPKWVYVPAVSGQLKKGDLILEKASNTDAIAPIINAMNNYFVHVMIATDNEEHGRHAFVDESVMFSNIKKLLIFNKRKRFKVLSKNLGIRLYAENFDLPTMLHPEIVTNLSPGITDVGKDKDKNGKITTDEIVKISKADKDGRRIRLTIRDESMRPQLEKIADEMIKMKGFYIVNAYMNMERYEPTMNGLDPVFDSMNISMNGTTCSGAIWWADKRARTNYDGGEMNIGSYDNAVISMAAEQMYEELYSKFYNIIHRYIFALAQDKEDDMQSPGYSLISFGVYGYLVDYVVGNLRHQIHDYIMKDINLPKACANQLLNAFLFNKSDDVTDYWRAHISEIVSSAVSPDDLLMAGMPTPAGTFTGIQTPESSFYNAIEDFTTSGGYYTTMTNDTAPVDPRSQGQSPLLLVTEVAEQIKPVPDAGEMKYDFEIIPIPEDMGGVLSKNIYYMVTNDSVYTPLQFTGATPAILYGDDEGFSFTKQPLNIIDCGKRSSYKLNFTFDPKAPGTYSTVVLMPNTDDNNSSFWYKVTFNAINQSHFIDIPIYYNKCENKDDTSKPLIGSQYGSKLVVNLRGGNSNVDYYPLKFNNGIRAYSRNLTKNYYSQAFIYPFNDTVTVDEETGEKNKPNLIKGTCAFWASAIGRNRDAGGATRINSNCRFFLTNNTYVDLYSPAEGMTCYISLIVDGSNVGGKKITQDQLASLVLQWDLNYSFGDGTNVRLFCDGVQCAAGTSNMSLEGLMDSIQRFEVFTKTVKEGGYRPKSLATAKIDNIIIWNKIVDAASIAAISKPKETVE